MELKIKNIGKVKNAHIVINGITVIAGENDTGKSTIGKALFTIFNSFYNLNDFVRKNKIESITNQLFKFFDSYYEDENFFFGLTKRRISAVLESVIASIIDKRRINLEDVEQIIDEMNQNIFDNRPSVNIMENKREDIELLQKRIGEILSVSDNAIEEKIISNNLDSEFNHQINNLFTNESASIELDIQKKKSIVTIEDDRVIKIENKHFLNTTAVYIDDPFILDDGSLRMIGFREDDSFKHRESLRKEIFKRAKNDTIQQIRVDEIIERILQKVGDIANGELLIKNSRTAQYSIGNNKFINMNNVSSGLKTFIIIKTLLYNGVLEENGTLILDEPEVHLHPAWQIKLAELIVLIQKEFNMHILLTTHSPYFLNAIEVYTQKYDLEDKTNYYLAENQNNEVEFSDVTKDIQQIYKKLATPFQTLENAKYEND